MNGTVNGNGMRVVSVKNKKRRETARVRTQEPLKNQLKRCEFRKSKRKSSGRKRKGKEKEGEVQKKNMVEKMQREDCKPPCGEDERR